MSQLAIITFLGALIIICSSFSVSAEERFALLIGNKNYGPQVGALKNPHKDIALIEKALHQVGFSVVSKKDLGRVEMHRQINAFIERLSKAGPGAVGFFYYVGHGVSNPHNRNNYLIPIDIPNMQDPDLWFNALPLDRILQDLERDTPDASRIVVFDACRNELRLPVRSGVKGFEPVTALRGTFIAFSTSPNATASDVGEDNGPYAQALASELIRPGQDHLALFQNVKERVISATGNTQWPWESNGLLRFYFAGQLTPPPKVGETTTPSRSPKSEIAIFRYRGANPNTEASNVFDRFRGMLEQKIINFQKEISQDSDTSVLDRFKEINVTLKSNEDIFNNTNEINDWLKSQPNVLNLLRGSILPDGETYKGFSIFYLGELKGYLKYDILSVDLPITAAEFANTKDSHTVVILYSLAMEAKSLGFPKNEIAIILKAAENKISDLERRSATLSRDLLDLKKAITNASNDLLRMD